MLYFIYGRKVFNTNDSTYLYLDYPTGYPIRNKEKVRGLICLV